MRERLLLSAERTALLLAAASLTLLAGCGGGHGGDGAAVDAQRQGAGQRPASARALDLDPSAHTGTMAALPIDATDSTGPAEVIGQQTPSMARQAAGSANQVTQASFAFALPEPRTTSAGVYAADGSLVRTLWRAEQLQAGTATRSWDLLDDQGRPAEGSSFTIRLIHHDVRYVWEGVVGNTSSRAGATRLHKAFGMPTALAAQGRRMHYTVGYNEAQSALNAFDLDNPQQNTGPISLTDAFVGAAMIATDGVRLYWANTGGIIPSSFVAAYELGTNKPAIFSAGTAVCLNPMPGGSQCYPAQSYPSVIELRGPQAALPTGLAVQKNGRLLAVAYGAEGQVRLYDKTSGQFLRSFGARLAERGVNQLAFTPRGDLWVLSADGATRYAGIDTAPAVAASIVGLARPLAIAADPASEGAVWIADGGRSQQLLRYEAAGSLVQTIGRLGGAGGSATVSTDALCFAYGPSTEQTAVQVDDSGAVWVVDSCNNRMLQFDARGRALNEIAYQPVSYVSAVDSGNPTRVFSNFLEFSVDYGRSLADPAGWKLVRNWLLALPAELRDGNSANGGFGGFRNVETLANGRSYAQFSVNNRSVIAELKADGSMRLIRSLPAPAAGQTELVLYENGDLGQAVTDGERQRVMRLPLLRFDSQGDPVWAATPTLLASVPIGTATPHHRNGVFAGTRGPRFPLTESGKVVFFNPSVDADSGFHLGAAEQSGTRWAWQASPSGPLDGKGSFQTRKVDAAIQYGGSTVMTAGRSVVFGYHGEFYTDLGNGRVGQANQFMHYRDDGLFVGQFGVPSTRASSDTQPGLSGNAFSPTLVRHRGQTYLYHNDESSHGGVHRWRLVGAGAIGELAWSVQRSRIVARPSREAGR